MKIAINGTGVAGPALAWWLRRYGHEPVLFERAPGLRTGGYVIDFWGQGYDLAERMGLLPQLQQQAYQVDSLALVNRSGRTRARLDAAVLRAATGGRYFSIARSDLAATLYQACQGIETRFGISVTGLEPEPGGVRVALSDGSAERFDLVIGADGLHSRIRALAFGPEAQFERPLGIRVAAFTLPAYAPRNENTYISHAAPGRQVARLSIRDDRTQFLFTFRASGAAPDSPAEQKALLRAAFRDLGWEVPAILARLDESDDWYFDCVSQIRMTHWSKGRVALIGDAAACISLLGGEGTGLAMVEAYTLAGELHRAQGNYSAAFERYAQRLQPHLAGKQAAARRFASFFAPRDPWQVWLRYLGFGLASLPLLSGWSVRRMLQDRLALPDYAQTAGRP